jgi:hypothetical protein
VAVDGMRRSGAARWAAVAQGKPRWVTTSAGPVWAESASEDWAGCEKFQGNDLGYQGESGRNKESNRKVCRNGF